nr:hypothetical protein BaRGS_017836 [Batillaria attramentaria]
MSALLFFCIIAFDIFQPAAGTTESDRMTTWLSSASSSKPNVLFIVVDDLRPWLGCYGESFMKTPNIDSLAHKSVRFDRAYVQHGICAPSRASFMTGRRSDSTRVMDLTTYWRNAGGNFTTVSQYFKDNGYIAEGFGKIFHSGSSGGNTDDFPYSWSTTFDRARGTLDVPNPKASSVRSVVEEGGVLGDTMTTDKAIQRLKDYATKPEQPFFLAVGFRKPHLPFMYPQQYEDWYTESSIPLALHREKPTNINKLARTTFGELRNNYDDIKNLNLSAPDYRIPDNYQMVLRKGYATAVSYVDAQVGRVLTELVEAGLANNTIITFHSDHGFQLGENDQWTKHNNYETTVRIPMMVHVPGVTDVTDSPSTARPVEAVDLFPTLAHLAGLTVPSTCPDDSSQVATCVEGTSLVPLLRQTTGNTAVPWKDVAFSQYPRYLNSNWPKMGYTLRTADYRYTEWVAYDATTYRANYSKVYARELYVHGDGDSDRDPEEHFNMADNVAYAGVLPD